MDANGENVVRGGSIKAQYLLCGVVAKMNIRGHFLRGVIRSKSSPGIFIWLLAKRE